jgi:hypothetical protein
MFVSQVFMISVNNEFLIQKDCSKFFEAFNEG